ncbi:unnamed protein product [Acanthoscelides obtectus]|uniref:DDE Tnp4 domain-containing protein n=1 Tax=Acanthoscelides obtectus TaxID=200917 RepID=A0A9P0JY77_ACAOB|nr:unnamed protein product [Acanthoscelides obtectus]CAK1646193.1 Putative nuclease HARBI1 [Acanthoscelides obtectus]
MKIERQETFMRDAIPARVKLEVVMCFLSSGISYRLLAIFFRISKSSISKFIPEVCDVMYEALDEYLQVRDKREWEDIQVGFHHRWNFPGCCGAIDGKHVAIQAPPNNCGSSYGRNSDGGVFQASSLYPVLENGSLLPEGGFLVGDDAFPLKTSLLKRYPNEPTIAEKIYNCRFTRARRIVENAFGILVSRFRILAKPIQLQEETAIKMIRTTCELHNWLRKSSLHTYTPPGSIDYEDIVNFTTNLGTWRSEINALPNIARSRINNRSKIAAEKLREKYNFFCDEGAVTWQNYMINNK